MPKERTAMLKLAIIEMSEMSEMSETGRVIFAKVKIGWD
jgi:hypothetical protein